MLAFVLGVALSFTVGAAADARRTSSALDRLLSTSNAAHVAVAVDQSRFAPSVANRLLDQVDNLPQVAATSRLEGVYLEVTKPDGQFDRRFEIGSALGKLFDDHAIRAVNAVRLLEGRLPATDRPDEVVVNPEALALGGWHVGDVIDSFRLYRTNELDAEDEADPAKGTQLELTVVGVGRRPEEMIGDTRRAPQVYLFPAFGRAHPGIGFYLIDYIRLHDGSADEQAFQQATARISATADGDPLLFSSYATAVDQAERANRPQVVAIWLMAAMFFAATVLFAVQSLTRSLANHYRDLPTLRGLGVGRASMTTMVAMHGATIAAVAAVLAGACAYVSSAFTPFGAASDVEPFPGLRADPWALAGGVALVFATLVVLVTAWAWRLTAAVMNGATTGAVTLYDRARPGAARIIGRAATGPLASTARRFAFQSSGGRQVRTILVSVGLAVGLFAGTIAFASTVDTVVRTPRAHGWNWDASLMNAFGTIPDEALRGVVDSEEVSGATAFTTGFVSLGGRRVAAIGLQSLEGEVALRLSRGRSPQTADEIVLGRQTLASVGRSVGDRIAVGRTDGVHSMTIVGEGVFPSIGSARFGSLSLGDGVATIASVMPAGDPTGRYNGLFLTVSGDRPRKEQLARLREVVTELGCTDSSCFLLDAAPPQLAGYSELSSVWLPFGVALGTIIAVVLSYGIISTVRSRRHELAVLGALGMTGSQVTCVVVLQSMATAIASMLVGVPAGLLVASVSWRLFSASVGIDWPVHLPLVGLGLLVASTLVGAAAIGLAVGLASRRPVVLR